MRVHDSPPAPDGQRRCSPTAHDSISTVPRSRMSTIEPAPRQLPLPPPVPLLVVAATMAPCESGINPCNDCCCAARLVFAACAFAGEPAPPPTHASDDVSSFQ